MSHPVWVRGLKRLWITLDGSRQLIQSHPVWVRGLKHCFQTTQGTITPVAPRVGAWIETPPASFDLRGILVAPRVGAWIETYQYA